MKYIILLITLLIVGCMCPDNGCNGNFLLQECNPLTNCCDGIDNDGDGLTDDLDTDSCGEGGSGEMDGDEDDGE